MDTSPGSLRQFSTTTGFIASTRTPEDTELYISPQDVANLYGCSVTEGQIRFAMSIMHQVCCRASLWPEQYEQTIWIDRGQTQLAVRPVVQIMSAAGRYSYNRRDGLSYHQANLDTLGSTLVFGSPPSWEEIDTTLMSVDPISGQVLFPTGLFLLSYNEVDVRYIAGFQTIPDRAIAALINIINDVGTRGSSDRTYHSVGKVQQTFIGTGFVSEATRGFLEPFIVRSLY